LVQQHAHANGVPFRDAIASDERVRERLSTCTLDRLFDPSAQLNEVDATFARLGLSDTSAVGTDGGR
ncbi:MAG: hypothetical protein M3N45_10755, partial [Actinomycetota bacterium]|nr:hypothetical protein [Actinomycetota bacterium]